jgi:F0F1-type ATP synthase membrane subunit b/b'
MKSEIEKLIDWYFAKPIWYKILFFGLFVVAFVFVLLFFTIPSFAKKQNSVNTVIDAYEQSVENQSSDITKKQKNLLLKQEEEKKLRKKIEDDLKKKREVNQDEHKKIDDCENVDDLVDVLNEQRDNKN